MVKKACELKNLDELNLSEGTREYIERQGWTNDELVSMIRVKALDEYLYSEKSWITDDNKSIEELAIKLDEAGFIRHDLKMTCRVWDFYMQMFGEKHPFVETNEEYENIHLVTLPELDAIMAALWKIRLRGKYGGIVVRYYGLNGGDCMTVKDLGRAYELSEPSIHYLKGVLLGKLRRAPGLPNLFGFRFKPDTSFISYVMESPSVYSEICFNAGSRNYMKRLGIKTVEDILDLPKEDWFRMGSPGVESLKEIEDKMHQIGHEDFSILNYMPDTGIPEDQSLEVLGLSKNAIVSLNGIGVNTVCDFLNGSNDEMLLAMRRNHVDGAKAVMMETFKKLDKAGYRRRH